MGGINLDGTTIAILLTIIGGIFAWYKWVVARRDKRRDADDQHRSELNKAQDDKLQEHKERLDRHRELITGLDAAVKATREELHNNYVKHDRFLLLEKNIDTKLDELFKRQSAMARDLNQSIGQMKAINDAEVKDLVKGVQDAIANIAKS